MSFSLIVCHTRCHHHFSTLLLPSYFSRANQRSHQVTPPPLIFQLCFTPFHSSYSPTSLLLAEPRFSSSTNHSLPTTNHIPFAPPNHVPLAPPNHVSSSTKPCFPRPTPNHPFPLFVLFFSKLRSERGAHTPLSALPLGLRQLRTDNPTRCWKKLLKPSVGLHMAARTREDPAVDAEAGVGSESLCGRRFVLHRLWEVEKETSLRRIIFGCFGCVKKERDELVYSIQQTFDSRSFSVAPYLARAPPALHLRPHLFQHHFRSATALKSCSRLSTPPLSPLSPIESAL